MAKYKLSASQKELLENIKSDKWQVCRAGALTTPCFGYVRIGGSMTGMRFSLREPTVMKLVALGLLQGKKINHAVEEFELTEEGKKIV